MEPDATISIQELAFALKISPRTLKAFLESVGWERELPGRRIIPVAALPPLLELYRERYQLRSGRWEMPDALLPDDALADKALRRGYAEDVSFPASLPPSQGRIVHDLILARRPKLSVEIGSFIGVSSLWIASALRKAGAGCLIGIDLFFPKLPAPPFHYGALAYPHSFAEGVMREAGLDSLVVFLAMPSASYSRNFMRHRNDPVDFLFIDGDHSVGGCLSDFVSFYPLVPRGGCILLHDIHPELCRWKGPRWLLDNVVARTPGLAVEEIKTEPNFGMALIEKKTGERALPALRDARIAKILRRQRLKERISATAFFQRRFKSAVKFMLNAAKSRGG